ncbi:MAG TPA: hypothetical protein VN038_10635 [Dyadobacter sp.]|nr:hypothetical protein [Dyadobacter sp.]
MKSAIRRHIRKLNVLLFAFWNSVFGQLQPTPLNYSVSLVKDINPGSGGSFTGRDGIAMGNTLYFPAWGDIWKTTGTEQSTVRIKDLNPGSGADPNHLTALNGTLFFAATGTNGREVYKSDGTAAGTALVKDINPTGSSNPWALSAYNNILLFRADNGIDGEELWKTDGTAAGTVMIRNINKHEGSEAAYFNGKMAILNNIAYFIANDGLTGDELWRTDGTEGGTYLVRDINPTGSTGTYDLVVMNNMLYFLADDGIHGTELWRSDGTTAGTSIVKDLQLSGGITQLSWLVVANNLLFMSLLVNGDSELYKSDGTATGTVRVKNINPFSGSSPGTLTKVGNQVFFTAYEPVYGRELWKSDGTSSGTVMIKDLTTNGSSDIGEMKEANGRLFFTLESDEPYVSNGTADGTRKIADINPSGPAVARTYMALGTQVFFFAGAPELGRELYKAVPCTFCPVAVNAYASAPPTEPLSGTNLKILGNPIRESLIIELAPNRSGTVLLELMNMNGSVLAEHEVPQAARSSKVIFNVQKQPAGLMMLRVVGPTETKLIKVVKAD